MVLLAFALGALTKPNLVPEPFPTFDGTRWSGLVIGETERDLKERFETGKTDLADPASIDLPTDRSGWNVSAILTKTGGKGSVVGFAAESNQALLSEATLIEQLGAPDLLRTPEIRFSDWSVEAWKAKGIAAVIERGQVRKVLMAKPEVLATQLDLWPTDAPRIQPEAAWEVGDVRMEPDLDLRENSAEVALAVLLGNKEARLAREYKGPGWVGAPGGRSTITFTINVKQKGKREFTLNVTGRLDGQGRWGNGSTSGSASDTVRDTYSVGQRTLQMIDEIALTLGKNSQRELKRKAWQTEWRPFYALAR